MLKVQIRFVEPFWDFTLLPDKYEPGDEVIVDESLVERLRQSGAVIDVLETLVKNPKKKVNEA